MYFYKNSDKKISLCYNITEIIGIVLYNEIKLVLWRDSYEGVDIERFAW